MFVVPWILINLPALYVFVGEFGINEIGVHGDALTEPQGAVLFNSDYLQRFQEAKVLYAVPYHQIPNAVWSPAPDNSVKINVDAALFKLQKSAGLGLVARDHNGNIVAWLSQNSSAFGASEVAETVAVVEGLKLALEFGWSNILIEGDNITVMKSFQNSEDCLSSAGVYVQEGLMLLDSFSYVDFLHIRREGNVIAHGLAKEISVDCDGITNLPFTL